MWASLRPLVALILVFFLFESYRLAVILAPYFTSLKEVSSVLSSPQAADTSLRKEPPPPPPVRRWTEQEVAKERFIAQFTSDTSVIRKLWPSEWTSLDWIADKSLIQEVHDRQLAFLASPRTFRPQPVLYRPILGGMGWGNLMYDISHHVIFAMMLKRPLLIMFDKKDQSGKLGWNAAAPPGVFHFRVFDWRWGGKPDLAALYDPARISSPSANHELVTCRQGYAFNDKCGGDQEKGNFEPLFPYFRSVEDKPLYSEYSASFIRPLINAPSFKQWITTHLGPQMYPLGAQLRFAFNVLFQTNATFREQQILPHLAKLTAGFTQKFVTVHVRTGHLELGEVRDQTSDLDVRSLETCFRETNGTKWLLLTDNGDIAQRCSHWAYTTVSNSSFSLAKYHVGYSGGADQGSAWEISLRDWLLLVESTGPVLLRSRMSSAFSFGQRGALIGGMQCTKSRGVSLSSCANNFFDEMCMHV